MYAPDIDSRVFSGPILERHLVREASLVLSVP